MKVHSTTLLASVTCKGLLTCMIAVLFSMPAFGQGFTPQEEIGNLSEVEWKPTADLLPAIASEQSRMATALSPTAIAADEKALYKAYQRLLVYLQADIQAGKALDAAILESYIKVLNDSTTDPELKNMPSGVLATYVPGLVEMLAAPIKPTTAN